MCAVSAASPTLTDETRASSVCVNAAHVSVQACVFERKLQVCLWEKSHERRSFSAYDMCVCACVCETLGGFRHQNVLCLRGSECDPAVTPCASHYRRLARYSTFLRSEQRLDSRETLQRPRCPTPPKRIVQAGIILKDDHSLSWHCLCAWTHTSTHTL